MVSLSNHLSIPVPSSHTRLFLVIPAKAGIQGGRQATHNW